MVWNVLLFFFFVYLDSNTNYKDAARIPFIHLYVQEVNEKRTTCNDLCQ